MANYRSFVHILFFFARSQLYTTSVKHHRERTSRRKTSTRKAVLTTAIFFLPNYSMNIFNNTSIEIEINRFCLFCTCYLVMHLFNIFSDRIIFDEMCRAVYRSCSAVVIKTYDV